MQKNAGKTKEYDEVWAVDAKRIERFFLDLGDTAGNVRVIALPERRVGMLAFPQTRVIIAGEDAEEIHRKFALNFMSAGG